MEAHKREMESGQGAKLEAMRKGDGFEEFPRRSPEKMGKGRKVSALETGMIARVNGMEAGNAEPYLRPPVLKADDLLLNPHRQSHDAPPPPP
jgi:hypothetical protein